MATVEGNVAGEDVTGGRLARRRVGECTSERRVTEGVAEDVAEEGAGAREERADERVEGSSS